MIVEIGLMFIGIALYKSVTHSVSSAGKYGFALMILILMVLFIGNIFAPAPPNMISVAVTMTAGQLALVALAFWVDMKRKYVKASKKEIAESSWYMRFTPELVEFLKVCVTHAIEQLALEQNKVLSEKLAKFKDVLIQDSTIIRLHKSLAKKWPAARSKTIAAGVKVGMLVSAVANSPKSIGIYAETTNELKTLRIGPWMKDRILLIDL